MKIIFGSKSGQSFQKEVEKQKEGQVVGKKIGEALDGGIIGLEGYELTITGGSDASGFPMRSDIAGQRRTNAVLSSGTGIGKVPKGVRLKKRVVGNTVSQSISQVNCKITKEGSKKLDELGFVPKPKEEKPAEEAAKK
ncbi:30S ribosomal protein S6e [Candidatus Micrarchaeota archaeon]|nr:30S ribosomal protein S6e [Candidatus Micrarchaeota archaeon]